MIQKRKKWTRFSGVTEEVRWVRSHHPREKTFPFLKQYKNKNIFCLALFLPKCFISG